MNFEISDKVQSKSDPSKVGIIEAIGPMHAGLQYYKVFWGMPIGTTNVPEIDLKFYQQTLTPIDNLINNNLAGYQEFQRLITYQRLLRDYPLRNNIYAFNASRTRFYPYQFKPLIKLLESPSHRLLICDEVGLGKTIEAGLILIELQARQTMRRVLVVCPANLSNKWQIELRKRFGEEFNILQAADFKRYLDRYEEEYERTKLKGIISLECIRREDILNRLDALSPNFDMVIVDEAHHMRNFGRKQRKAGMLLSRSASAMILLTATPVHLGNENLFSLLNILDEEEFPELWTANTRFTQNEPVIKAQICLGQIPPKLKKAYEILHETDETSWIRNNPLFLDILERLNNVSIVNRRQVIELQKDLAELNLIGHLFTRTRKREVQSGNPKRHAFSLEIALSSKEKEFYEAVTNFVKAETHRRGFDSIIQQWLLNMPQRRMASSIPAMVDYYKENVGFDIRELNDKSEIFAEEMEPLDVNWVDARKQLKKIINEFSSDMVDSKYQKFITILNQIKLEENTPKIMVFAFFKDTLKYLSKRLQQDGFNPLYISGDIKMEERISIIDKFQNEPQNEILLSSRVGSEGLDFQFCNIMFNYDLPWNPMEVEQRIGRLDRIGQESPIIRIYNFWIKDTIEERILRRLYERIKIFEHSIGELEVILGEVVQQLESKIFTSNLTPEEEKQEVERAIWNLEHKMKALEELESEAAQFVGTDQYFEDEVNAIKRNRRYITGEQLRRFIVDFIKYYAPRTRLEYDSNSNTGIIFPDDSLRSFIYNHKKSSELSRFLSTRGEGIKLTFNSDVAFNNPNIEFINILHPLVIAITEQYDESFDKHINAQHVVLKTNIIKEGFYFFFIFRLRVQAARGRNTLECIILDQYLDEACDTETAEMVFGEMVENGNDPSGLGINLNQEQVNKAYEKARELFLTQTSIIRNDVEKNNDRFVESRLNSLKTSYTKNLNKQRDLLVRAQGEGRQDRYLRMLTGTIKRLERELSSKQSELELRRKVEVGWDEVAAGILEVV